MTQTPKLRWNAVHKRFGGPPVLDGMELAVSSGRSLVLIGGSGQGKSVTIKLALGLLKPDAGSVTLDGVNVAGLDADSRAAMFGKVGMLFQGGALFDSLSIWENVAFRLINAERMDRAEARARAVEALALVRLGEQVAHLIARQGIEPRDHAVGLGAPAGVGGDRGHQVVGAPVVEEKQALAQSPQRRGAPVSAIGVALADAVVEAASHIMQGEVAIRMIGDVAQGRDGRTPCGLRRHMAGLTAEV